MNNQNYKASTLCSRYTLVNLMTFVRVPLFLLLVVFCLTLSASHVSVQMEDCTAPEDGPYPISPGDRFTRPMGPNQRHVFRLLLGPRQFTRVIVDQKGLDVVIRLQDPNRALLVERDNPNSKFGPEAVSIAPQTEAVYYIEVCANELQPSAAYDLRVERIEDATEADSRVEAERRLMQGRNFGKQRTVAAHNLAIEQFNQAVEIFRTIGDKQEEGYALCSIGEQHRFLRRFAEAMQHFDLALARLGEVPDLSGQAYVFNEMGAAHRDLADPLKALPFYERALELRRRIGDRWGQAQLHNNVGVIYTRIGEQQKALANFELALSLWREFNDRGMELNTLNLNAKANLELGNFTVAFEQLQTVLDACIKENKACSLEALARNSHGVIHDTWGEADAAFQEYGKALELFSKANKPDEVANVLDNTGMLFAGIGDTTTAVEYFQKALKIRQQDLNHSGEEVTRSNLGYAYMLMGKHADALKELGQAQQFSRSARNQRFEAYTLTRMGTVLVALQRLNEALACYKQALEIQKQIEDVRGQAISLDKIGQLYSLIGQPALSLRSYGEALKHWTTIRDRQGEALSLYGMARVQRDQKRFAEARDLIVAAIEKVESLRTRMTSHRFRLSYVAARYDYYELEIDLRMRLYETTRSKTELELALFASERARARNLLDFLTESRANIRQGVDPMLLAQERAQRDQLAEKWAALQRKKHSDEERIRAEGELQTLTRAFDQTQAEIRRRSPRYASLSQPQPLKLAEVQQLLDKDTALLEYALGEKRSYLWVVTPTEVLPFTLPRRALIEQAIAAFRKSITAEEPKTPNETDSAYIGRRRRGQTNYPQQALTLSQMVLGPAFSVLENKRLVIVADDTLQYVPFAALPIPARDKPGLTEPLIARNEIVYQPSASALKLIREASRPTPTKTAAVFADPVFDSNDERVRIAGRDSKQERAGVSLSLVSKLVLRDAGDIASAGGSLRLERLKNSLQEANAIVGAIPPGSFLKATDFDASRANFLSQDLKQYRILHLATHGILNTQHPELSGLVFSLVDKDGKSADGVLRVGDVYNLELPIDMVVLSACRTGVGKLVGGEGLVGLTRGFMHAGTARVVASLWNVNDEATAELMKRFYANMLQRNMPAAAALRQAQLEIIKTQVSPYHWAGFVLQGEWK